MKQILLNLFSICFVGKKPILKDVRAFLKFWAILVGIGIGFSLFAGEEDQRNFLRDLYLTPLEVILPKEMQALDSEERLYIDPDSGVALREKPQESPESDTEGPPETGPKSLDTKRKEAEGLLKRYYAQFIEEKRIWEERERGSIYSSRTEQNDIRLLLFETTHKNTETLLVKESPILYELHLRLAKIYTELEKPSQAIRHFIAAYRYRSLGTTEEYFLSSAWEKEDFRNQFAPQSKNHKQAKETRDRIEKELKQAKDKVYILEAEAVRNNIGRNQLDSSLRAQNNQIAQKQKEYEMAEKNYQDSFQKNYLPFFDFKRKEDSANFYQMAKSVKRIEDDNKERLKIINKSSVAGKGIFVLFDYKKNRDYFAYELLLEKSYQLWNDNLDPVLEIAERFRTDGRKEKALDFYAKLISLLESKKTPTPEETSQLTNAYFRFASLNADLKRNVSAGESYEKFFLLSSDSPLKTKVSYEMGNFFLNVLGEPQRAKPYFEYWLERNSTDWNPAIIDPKNQSELEAMAYFGLSKFDRMDRNPDAERGKLQIAVKNFRDLETNKLENERKLQELREKKLRIKKELISTTQDEALSQYRILDIKIEDQEAILRNIDAKLKSIPIARIFIRLATISEKNRDFQSALTYYDEVIDKGVETDIDLAMKEKKRVLRILETGKVVPPLNESIL